LHEIQIERNNKEDEEAKQITRTDFSGVKSKPIYPRGTGLPHGKTWPLPLRVRLHLHYSYGFRHWM